MSNDKTILEVSRLQREIASYLSLGATEVIFDFEDLGKGIRLNVITVNPRHNQSFLFHFVEGYDKVDCLKQMYEYIRTYKEKRILTQYNGQYEMRMNCIHHILERKMFWKL